MKNRINRLLLALVFVITFLPAIAQHAIQVKPVDGLENNVFMYRDTTRNIDGRGSMNAPMFMIYPDKPLNEAEANALIHELSLDSLVFKYAGSVGVINPVGKTYHAEADLDAYIAFVNRMRSISNLKILGIGNGATFVNDVISRNAGEVAGIFVYGGKITKKTPSDIPVPAYISGGDRTVAAHYIKANKAKEVAKSNQHLIYANEDEPLQQVVLHLDKKTTLKEAVADAWKNLLSKNYRFSNYKHTTYMGGKFGEYGNYELEPYLMLDELGVTRKTVVKTLNESRLPGTKAFFWYEFIPETTVNAPKQSVPLVVLLHGNNNDNRTQSETSGFIEVAAKEHFIVAEIEWQGAGTFPSEGFLGLDGIELVVEEIIQNYPQIDPSRVYVQGLSAGAMTSAALGIRKSHLFAAVAGHSGAIFDRPVFGYTYQTLLNEAKQKAGFVETPYFLITGTDDDVIAFPNKENYKDNSFFNAIRLYQQMNDLPEIEIDFNVDPVLGIKLQDRETILTNKHMTLETGKLYKKNVPLIQFTAIMHYGHWNYRPAAQMMWDFFKQFSRDPETRKLIYHPNK
ncbi:PHB depolymerase family esterase [Parabacteroides sp. PF5-9]|uniref:PHB depolymerase family esterase n=1 Tax=Parabacteroides sp. PF5-9 TaxID=1742404 RepID=UPI00247466F9|nr:PHB depolymerase family esterase [Parabacteroides sp. PF5-9]MDH6358892.1 putative esterase [Parabacteroides sp. PF5-9]